MEKKDYDRYVSREVCQERFERIMSELGHIRKAVDDTRQQIDKETRSDKRRTSELENRSYSDKRFSERSITRTLLTIIAQMCGGGAVAILTWYLASHPLG